jgi:glycerate kinase
MKILIVPDSFKGSLTAINFCSLVSHQIEQLMSDVKIISMPLADGGEGTIDSILANTQGQRYQVAVHDSLHRSHMAQYAILTQQHTAIIEMAQASGLPLLTSNEQNPLITSSYGTGELLLKALNQGCRKLIIGLGGSATNDGEMGLLSALGLRFFDQKGKLLNGCGKNLHKIAKIDDTYFDPRLNQSEIIIAGDVTNPLLGHHGATHIFAPQKGANETMVLELETGMAHFAQQVNLLSLGKI